MILPFVRRATKADALYIAENLREADRQEVLAASGGDPRIILPALVDPRWETLCAGMGDTPVVLFGCHEVYENPDVGVIWMLSTPVINRHRRLFMRCARRFVDVFHKRHTVLTNFIDARNTVHIRWLKLLGFKMLRRVPYGAQSLPFIEFARPHV